MIYGIWLLAYLALLLYTLLDPDIEDSRLRILVYTLVSLIVFKFIPNKWLFIVLPIVFAGILIWNLVAVDNIDYKDWLPLTLFYVIIFVTLFFRDGGIKRRIKINEETEAEKIANWNRRFTF